MSTPIAPAQASIRKGAFLTGVFLITFAVLVFQIVQTRILSVLTWYYLAFFAISVAMLGMTVGAVWVYVRRDRFRPERFASTLSDCALACAVSLPISLALQFALITTLTLSLTTIAAWALLFIVMAVPYVFAGVVVSLALTRSPFPVSQVYGVDLLGAALGCVAVVLILDVLDAPSTIILAGAISGMAALSFAWSAVGPEGQQLKARAWWCRPLPITLALLALTALNASTRMGIRPVMVKDVLEVSTRDFYARWNSYSRIVAAQPTTVLRPYLWGPSPTMPASLPTQQAFLSIDGSAGTAMHHYDGTLNSIAFLRYDLVNLAYNLPGIRKAAVIGVGGGRDILSAHLYGVPEIVGVELNPIFIDLHTRDPFYKSYSNLTALPNLKLYVDDARSWFASTDQTFDLVQMSMIDTWAATGAGAYSLSESGLYTVEGWRAFVRTLNDGGVFTVSRWFDPKDINETGRVIGLGAAALLDAGARDVAAHMFVATAENIATLVLSKRPFSPEAVKILRDETDRLGFHVLLAPGQPPQSDVLLAIMGSKDIAGVNAIGQGTRLDLTVPTDNRPFFFNELRLLEIPAIIKRALREPGFMGILRGNLLASMSMLLILVLSLLAVVGTILLPLRRAITRQSPRLIIGGSLYFALIGMGFMLAEISLLQYFSIYLGHPIYSLGVCLFSLILATGLGSLASGKLKIGTPRMMLLWSVIVVAYLLGLQQWLTQVFEATTGRELGVRIAVSLAAVMPLGFLLGFAFPTGMKLVEAVDKEPTPWFWGINGATGVLASVLAIVLSMTFGIRVTLVVSSLCYLALLPVGFALMRLGPPAPHLQELSSAP